MMLRRPVSPVSAVRPYNSAGHGAWPGRILALYELDSILGRDIYDLSQGQLSAFL